MLKSLRLGVVFAPLALSALNHPLVRRAGSTKPGLITDPNLSPHCSWWLDNTGGEECQDVLKFWVVTLDDMKRWNPSITGNCENFQTGHSYCVEAAGEPPVSKPLAQSAPTLVEGPSTAPSASPTPETPVQEPSNSITTPQPVQPGIAPNCDSFYLVKAGDSCDSIARQHGISLANFLAWNSGAGASCGGLWSGTHACVHTIGHNEDGQPGSSVSGPEAPSSETPQPTQPNIPKNCDKFYLVKPGETCASVANANDLSVTQFLEWNPSTGSSCSGLWANAHACVSVKGYIKPPPREDKQQPSPTTPNAGNGITTPQPTQPDMVKNCKKFHFVLPGETCSTLANSYKVSIDDIMRWNPKAGKGCSGLWANANACVSVID